MINTPLSGGLSDLENNYWNLIQTMQQMQNAKQQEASVLDSINKELGSLTKEELQSLSVLPEYKNSRALYEAGFMAFLGSKFSAEYANTSDGKIAALGFLEAIKKSKDKIAEEIKSRQDKVNAMLTLLEKDPEIKKRYDKMMLEHGK